MTTKTNKSFTKRLKVTKSGKLLAQKPGRNHFKAKESRTKQLRRHTEQSFTITNKSRGRFLPHA